MLGFDFLDALAVKIDYANGDGRCPAARIACRAARDGRARRPVERANAGGARATVADATGDDFIIDTGTNLAVVVFQRFARAHPDVVISLPDERVRFGSAVGGSLGYRPIETRRLELGSLAFDDAPAVEALSPDALGFDNKDGLIGSDLLRRFTVYLDYAADRVYLAPAARVVRAPATPHPASPFSFRRRP